VPSRLPPVQPAQSVFDEGLPRLTGNPYILPGHRQGQHLSNIDISWQRIRATAGVLMSGYMIFVLQSAPGSLRAVIRYT